jgi:hypothetical protein
VWGESVDVDSGWCIKCFLDCTIVCMTIFQKGYGKLKDCRNFFLSFSLISMSLAFFSSFYLSFTFSFSSLFFLTSFHFLFKPYFLLSFLPPPNMSILSSLFYPPSLLSIHLFTEQHLLDTTMYQMACSILGILK